jgi:hypothetical protein
MRELRCKKWPILSCDTPYSRTSMRKELSRETILFLDAGNSRAAMMGSHSGRSRCSHRTTEWAARSFIGSIGPTTIVRGPGKLA